MSHSLRFVSRAFALLRSMLLEIFDESAYARFLSRQGIVSSPAAYRQFLKEQQTRNAHRFRCC